MLYQNSSKGNEEFALLRTSLSRAISWLSIIFSLESLKEKTICNIKGVLGLLLVYCCRSSLFSSEM